MASRDTDLIGETIDGKYRVEALLGRGGMGAVFRAVHLGTDRVVALKVIAPALAEQPEYLARFSREARACGRLRHPGIVDVTDFGIAKHNGRSLAYLVMEFLDGSTLADVLKAQPRPPLPWVIDILEQTCSAVEEAHRQGILHRDLKPENVWLEPNRRGGYSVKVLDFGLAKLSKDEQDKQDLRIEGLQDVREAAAGDSAHAAIDVDATFAGATLDRTIDTGVQNSAVSTVTGTPAYMSPEQTRGELVSARSDVYSLGVMAYRMVSGQLPFEGSVTDVLNAQLNKEPPPLRTLRPDVHEDAARLIAAALSKDPARRPASAGTFGNMLGAQLEPAGAFFRRAAILMIDRLGLFLKLGAIACAPMLLLSVAVAAWQLSHEWLGLPAIGARGTGITLTCLFILSLVAQSALGVMPIFVLRAIAEPLRPLDVGPIWRAYRPRIERWVRAMLPFMLSIAGLVLSLIAMATLAGWLRPQIQQLPRAARTAVGLIFVFTPFAVAYAAMRRNRITFRNMGLLGAAMLVENLPFRAAVERATVLVKEAGGLRNAVQKWFTVAIAVLSGLIGFYVGLRGGRNAAASFPIMLPVITVAFMLLLTVNGTIAALIYLSARRARGESMEQILEEDERLQSSRMGSRHLALALCVAFSASVVAQPKVTAPKAEFGFNFGDDYQLATYTQLVAYWQKLDRESDRMVVQEIGKTSEGRPHLMAIVTSPDNHKNLARIRDTARRLALAEGLTDDQARALARDGKTVVWIDGGLHASEVLGAQQLGEMIYQMVTRTDEETMRFLNDTVILFVHANPDGHELVANWYMRHPVPEKRSGAGLPLLYHHYIGHDNNRDFYASTQKETENINRVLYHEWSPQILYNHHQSGPAGTVFWSPPFRDPFNYNQDPLLVLGLQQLGLTIHARMAAEGKPGASMRAAGAYDGWWNGGIRNTAAFHNVLAILTEMIGNPTPMRIPLVLQRQLPTSDLTFPITPQDWHFRQSIEYSITANRAVLDFASRWRETVLFNTYQMGRNAIQRGSADHWTPAPHRYAAVAQKMGVPMAGGGRGGATNPDRDAAVMAELRRPEYRDARGYIIPSTQADFPTAVKFINALREVGIKVQRATRDFDVQGKKYPAGSFVVMTAQSFRPHVVDMFEPQDHPDNVPYPGAAPTPPYDYAGWTLAFQMGVEFDRVLEGFTGPFENVTDWNVKPPAGRITGAASPAGYLLSHQLVDSFVALNRLLGAGEEAYWLPDGRWYVTARPSTRASLEKIAADLGVSAEGTTTPVPSGSRKLRRARVGLWDQYGGSMDSGWARWILEQYGFQFEKVFAPTLDAGNLNAKYDVLVFVEGGIPASGAQGGTQPAAADIPAEYRAMLGRVSAERTIPEIRRFVENGGTVVTIGASATNIAAHLRLPVEDHLVEGGKPLPESKFYTPGSVVTARVDTAHPLAHGMKERTDFFFDNSPVFRLAPNAQASGVKSFAWFDSATPLKSGWSWGQPYLQNGVAAIDAPLGKGRVVLFGPEIMKRAQPHATFKLLFNAIYLGAAM